MSAFRSLMKDSVYVVKNDGRRLGPYQSAVSSNSITIMEDEIDVDEGDHVARLIPSGKEEIYLVLSADFSCRIPDDHKDAYETGLAENRTSPS